LSVTASCNATHIPKLCPRIFIRLPPTGPWSSWSTGYLAPSTSSQRGELQRFRCHVGDFLPFVGKKSLKEGSESILQMVQVLSSLAPMSHT
jgi:hypothetical protein